MWVPVFEHVVADLHAYTLRTLSVIMQHLRVKKPAG